PKTPAAEPARAPSGPGAGASAPDAAPPSDDPARASSPTTAEPDLAAKATPMSGRGEVKSSKDREPTDAGVTVVEKDGGAKQFRFTETDIEGQLKAPQLVYFLRRVRAEFAAGDLGHRSFLRELSETKHDPTF